MKIWILVKKENFHNYENSKYREVAREQEIDLEFREPEKFELIVTRDDKKSILYDGHEVQLPDVLIPRMGANTAYFSLAIIRHLERLGVLVLNSSHSIETAKDKLAVMQILAASNLPIPKTMLAKFPINLEVVDREFTYPLIVKTVSGVAGKGVFLCENRAQFVDLTNLMEISRDSKVNVIIQEFISSSRGKDIRVYVVGGRPIAAMLRTAREGNFKANYSAGGDVAPFQLNPQVEWLAVESARLINLDIAGVDILFDGEGYKICEVNSSPGFEGFEKATGLNVPREVFNYLRVRISG